MYLCILADDTLQWVWFGLLCERYVCVLSDPTTVRCLSRARFFILWVLKRTRLWISKGNKTGNKQIKGIINVKPCEAKYSR